MIQIEWNLLEKENLYIYDTVIIFNYKIKPDTTFSCSFKAKISVICFLQGDVLREKKVSF